MIPKSGLRVLSGTHWHGPGYCGICGDRGPSLEPKAVRWWDPDDGWKMGALCVGCAEGAKLRPPRPEDYAFEKVYDSDRIDIAVELDDLDGAYSNNR